MKFKTVIAAAFAVALSCVQAFGQATILPNGESCFQAATATSGGPAGTGTGFIGLLGTITGGSLYTNGTYGGVSLTGGSGSNATANITVSGGAVTVVQIVNPGVQYVVGDVLSATAASIGGTGSGFSVPVSSVSINNSMAGGSVGMYIPNTTTTKQTWQNSGQTVLNQNPIPLDANGCALIYGVGSYRQILKDSLGNTIWDQVTAATNGSNGIFWAQLASGTPNAITVTDTAFSNQDGYNLQFLAKSENTGPVTIAVSGGTPIAVVKDTSTGPAALTGGEIGPNNVPMVTYDATNIEFHLINPSSSSGSSGTTASIVPPQGYLNLVGQSTGDVIQNGDVVAATTIFYSPFVGNVIPIWNGSTFVNTTFSELTMTLTAAGSTSNTIQDACVFSNNGVPTLVLGPSWQTVTAGSGARGTGAGTPQLTRLNGIWVNAVQITAYNGLSSYSIGANQCTYVGSVSIDSSAGQVSAYRTYGQSRKFGVWNTYNRQPIVLQVGDSTGSWTYNTFTTRFSNNNAANTGAAFIGLPEEETEISFIQTVQPASASPPTQANIFIGINSSTIGTGKAGSGGIAAASGVDSDFVATTVITPAIGIQNINCLERGNGTGTTFFGANAGMVMNIRWRG